MTEKTPKVDIDDARYRTTLSQQAAAACTGALITSIFVTPLDVVKIRLQAQQKAMTRCFLYCNGLMDHICGCTAADLKKQWYSRPSHFNGTIDAFVKITRNEGFASLWSGLSPTLVLAIPATVIYFVTYEQLRLRLKDNYNKDKKKGDILKQPYWIPMMSGATARVFSASIVSPLELVRTKMQSERLSYLEIGNALKVLIRQDGTKGLWKGVFPTLLRDVPFSAVYWAHYETIKSFYGPDVPSFSFSFVAGAISGGIAATLTVPFDVVKTHQQIELGARHIHGDTPTTPQTTQGILKQIYEQHGVRGLFAGLAPRLIKVAPACAIMIATFEHGKIVFNRLANSSFPITSNNATSSLDSSTNFYIGNVGNASNLSVINSNITNKMS